MTYVGSNNIRSASRASKNTSLRPESSLKCLSGPDGKSLYNSFYENLVLNEEKIFSNETQIATLVRKSPRKVPKNITETSLANMGITVHNQDGLTNLTYIKPKPREKRVIDR